MEYICAMSEAHIGDAIKQFINTSKLKSGIHSVKIENVWEDVMGKTIARHTDKIQIINSTLFIQTSLGALKQELLYQKEKIIHRINEALGENIITKVVIQ